MILYLDTSSLVKLFVEEPGTDEVRSWADQAEILATSRVAYAEAMAAFARRHRDGSLDDEALATARAALEDQWHLLARLEIDELEAGELALQYALRGFDAIHLAAALTLLRSGGGTRIAFSSFDHQLNRAAAAKGLEILTIQARVEDPP